MWVIACVLHNLIYGDSTVTYVPWSEFSILGISSSFSQKRGEGKEIDHVDLKGDLIMT